MNRSDLEKIIAIAEEGTMAKAAEKLFISQPALSRCLTRVEEELGEVLFTRRPNGLSPTYALPRFLKYAYQILHLYDQISMEFCEINELRTGELKFGSSERLGALVLPVALKVFHERYPNINICLVEDHSDSLEDAVSLGSLDLAVMLLPIKNTNLQYRVFHRDPYLIALPMGHDLCSKAYYKPGEETPYMSTDVLRGQNLVLTTKKKKSRQVVNSLLETFCGDYNTVLETNNVETLVKMVAQGMGISLIPSLFAQAYDNSGKVMYCRMEPKQRLYHDWVVIWSGDISGLTRPSRELFHIICEDVADMMSSNQLQVKDES